MLGQSQAEESPDHKRNPGINLLLTTFLALAFIVTLPAVEPKTKSFETAVAQSLIPIGTSEIDVSFLVLQENTIRPVSGTIFEKEPIQVLGGVIVTGYSSTPWQTDETPFETASGACVQDGVVATNLLPFGSKIRIPEIYGNKVFVVEDRMHYRNNYNVDIWFENYWQAKSFGVARTEVEVLE